MPYQFYHHAHKMLCDHDQSEKLFLFWPDPVKCNAGPVITLQPTLTVALPVLYCKHNKGVEHNANRNTTVRTVLKKPSQIQVILCAPQVPQPCPYPIQVICQCPCLLHKAFTQLQVKLGPNHSQSLCIVVPPTLHIVH